MSLRTPLSRVTGLGSAKEGVSHWWWQRLTAIALIPLTLWFVFSLASYGSNDHSTITNWMSSPLVASLLILFIGSLFYHAQLGLQVVIEDYVHNEAVKVLGIIVVKFASIFLALVAILAVLKVAVSG
ncbi:MAG: succinate dehydrogenase, hydrophobic membrane anchor protein [Gammaproteobacteria bacterium]|nr:succinate dehydrogenase, hydrophobic membrane anchor protein [Gammaproteobacteria bacterium]